MVLKGAKTILDSGNNSKGNTLNFVTIMSGLVDKVGEEKVLKYLGNKNE
jgi:hypothetical protein